MLRKVVKEPPSYNDSRAVFTSYDVRREIKTFALHPNQQLIAVGCLAELKLLKLDTLGNITECFSTIATSGINTSIADMAWSVTDQQRLAISTTSGEIKVFRLSPANNSPPSNNPPSSSFTLSHSLPSSYSHTVSTGTVLQLEWVGEKSSQPVYRLAWSPHETQILATGHTDGSVKFYDLRDGKKSSIQVYRVKSATPSSCRDLQFNPMDKALFATAADNGRLYLWDRRHNKKPLLSFEAHKAKVLSIAWHPFVEGWIATGSADKTVKVWDTGQCALFDSNSSISDMGGYNVSVAHQSGETEPLLLHTLQTAGEVSQLLWNPLETSPSTTTTTTAATTTTASQSSCHHLLTMSSSVSSSEGSSSGSLCLWDLDRPHIPIVILKGHGDDRCSRMDWVDCQRSSDLIEYRMSRSLSTSKTNKKASSNSGDSPVKPRVISKREVSPVHCPWVLSASQEGTLLIQSPKYGYFPYNHVSPIVAMISSQGHLAYQHCEVKKMEEPPRSLPSAALLKSQRLASTTASSGSVSPSKRSPETDLGAFSVVGKTQKSSLLTNLLQPTHSTAGKVYFGFAEFETLEAAAVARSKGGAEATVFDPALIYLLAKHYSIPQPPPRQTTDSHLLLPTPTTTTATAGEEEKLDETTTTTTVLAPVAAPVVEDYDYLVTCYEIALASCRHNFEVASLAGLRCRAALWASLEALIPYPVQDFLSPTTPTTTEAELFDHPSKEISFSLEVLSSLLLELLEGGDSQHFVVVCEILRCAQVLATVLSQASIISISAQRIRSIYIAYLELLMKQELFSQANQIIKGLDDEQIATLSQKDVDLKIKCATCKKDLRRKGVNVAAATVWCETCQRCVSKCSLCDQPVTGLLQWCPICGHGGHLRCLQRWFTDYTCCPTGCSHQCCFSFYQPQLPSDRLVGLTEEEISQVLEEEKYADIDSLLWKKKQLLQQRRKRQLERWFA